MQKIQPYTRKVHFYETDQMGIVHHSNYIRWFEEARVDFLEQAGYGYEKATLCGIDIGVAGVVCDYKSMVRFGDTVNVNLHITELKNASMEVSYTVCDASTGEVRATGKTKHFYFDRNNSRLVSLKKALPELYDIFASHIQDTAN